MVYDSILFLLGKYIKFGYNYIYVNIYRMNIGDIFELKIEKLTSSGAGLGKVNGFVVFVQNVCPLDVVRVKITKITKSFANGEVIEIITPSNYRVDPFCPMQKVCGACQIQFIDYDYQLHLTQLILLFLQ